MAAAPLSSCVAHPSDRSSIVVFILTHDPVGLADPGSGFVNMPEAPHLEQSARFRLGMRRGSTAARSPQEQLSRGIREAQTGAGELELLRRAQSPPAFHQ